MWLVLLQACRGYELVAANATIHVAPTSGDDGAFLDVTMPMRLELYGPAISDGALEARPYFGFIQAPVDAQVACVEDPVLDATSANDKLAIFFTVDVNDFEGMVAGATFTSGGTSTRREGHAEDVLDFDFPCLPGPIPHEVRLDWVVDRSAPIPYDGDP